MMATIAAIAEKKFSGRSDHMETTLHSYRSDSNSTKMHCVRSRFSRWLLTSLRKHPFLLALRSLRSMAVLVGRAK